MPLPKSPPRRIRVVLAQIPEQNSLAEIEAIIRRFRNSDLIVFPEATLTLTDLSPIGAIKALTRRYGTAVIIGIVRRDKRKLYDFAYYISPRLVDRYQKVHVHWTEKHIPGNEFKTFRTPFGKVGVLMCYDAAFQEAARILALMGAELIVIISAIPIQFPNEFATLRARALAYSNQLYLVHCCLPGRQFSGHSAIIDPQGSVIVELGKYAAVRAKAIDLERVREWRRQEKTFQYRRPSMYRMISSVQKPLRP
ncbi:MAG: carbon-nitrogen hydrolase family protein [Candidatus Zixiibacteriota bacterium]